MILKYNIDRSENRSTNTLSKQWKLLTIFTVQAIYIDGLIEEIANDLHLKKIVQDLILNPISHIGYKVKKKSFILWRSSNGTLSFSTYVPSTS